MKTEHHIYGKLDHIDLKGIRLEKMETWVKTSFTSKDSIFPLNIVTSRHSSDIIFIGGLGFHGEIDPITYEGWFDFTLDSNDEPTDFAFDIMRKRRYIDDKYNK